MSSTDHLGPERLAIDLRSDTVTKPTPSMRQAMASAPVGDDVYGEDPTVNALEERVAALLGKEAALYVPSGTMGNLIAVLSHCGRGDEMILGDKAHIFLYERGGGAALGGVQPRTLPNLPDGTLDLDQVTDAVRDENDHYPVSRLLALENTHNRCGGRALLPEYVDSAGALAHSRELQLHVDGARLWNAAVALGTSPGRLVQAADSVSVCFSKGLGAPVGSALVGSRTFIRQARRMRKQVGGGMRQAGILAAACLVALDEMVDRLADDHAHAQLLAQGLAAIDGVLLDPATVQTNIVYFDLADSVLDAPSLSATLAAQGVLINPTGARRLRAVTNFQVSAADIETVLNTIEEALGCDARGVATPAAMLYR
jgi:threonine aldolase